MVALDRRAFHIDKRCVLRYVFWVLDSMRVRIEYFGTIRDHIPIGFEIVEMPTRATVTDVVDRVLARYGKELGTALFAPQGEPLPNLVLTVNGVRIIEPVGMRKELRQEDVVTFLLMPPFTGGG